ncbi:unnamed protein product [Meganyctiphanes norvegica]|uniref:NACHT domain-containing protein n=1 Tax=Meganyctiphanes norvegica TaxID=48144 RepID=A0AAV2Q570_MEGNR
MSSGMTSHDEQFFRKLRYGYAATKIANKAMVIILLAFTEGKISATFKDVLLEYYRLLPEGGKREGLYKKEFNQQERQKLEDPSTNPEDFDITLIDKLLRRMKQLTGLAFHYNKVWTEDSPPGSNSRTEYLIYQVKVIRNDASHGIPDLTVREIEDKLTDMEVLYSNLVERVLNEKGKTPEFIRNKTEDIRKDFKELRNPISETLTAKDIAVYTKEKQELEHQLLKTTRESCRVHLTKIYQESYNFNPADWLDIDQPLNTEEIFTKIVIKEEEKDFQQSMPTTTRNCDYSEILMITEKTHQRTPRILTINSSGGNGKTTYTRLLVCKWGKQTNSIPKLDDVDILLYVELRGDSNKTFDDIIKLRLYGVMTDVGLTFQKLKQIIQSLNVLVILDGQDESPQNDLLINTLGLLSTQPKMRVIITTRPGASIALNKIINRYNIPKLDLLITGIDIEDQYKFISNYVVVMEKDTHKQHEILESVNAALPHLNDSMGEIMLSPLMLTLLTLLWVAGKMPGDSITTTQIFTKVNKLLKGKLESRLLLKLKTLSEVSLKAKLTAFEDYLEEIAYQCFCKKESNFEDSTVDLLINKIDILELSDVQLEILGHYLCPRKTRKDLEIQLQYSYRHLRMQEFAASRYVCKIISKGSNEEITRIMSEIQDERHSNIRTHTIALLAEKYPQLLTKYGSSIIDCEKAIIDKKDGYADKRNVDSFHRFVSESQCNKAVVDMVTTNMAQMPDWVVRSPSGLAALMVVLQQTQPENLTLQFDNQTSVPTSLTDYLANITKYHLELRLMLPYTPLEEDPSSSSPTAAAAVHDAFLSAATPPDGNATLDWFGGRLSRTGIQQLPPSLSSLWVGLSSEDLQTLFLRIPHITQLQYLSIYMRCSNLENVVVHLGKLQTTLDLALIRIALYSAEDTDLPHIASLVERCFTGAPLYLWLWEANITGDGAVKFLQLLCNHHIKCNEIWIKSKQLPSEPHQEEMRTIAQSCVSHLLEWSSGGESLDLTPSPSQDTQDDTATGGASSYSDLGKTAAISPASKKTTSRRKKNCRIM